MSERIKNLAIYRDLVARFFDDKVKGKANPYTSMNGNMYSLLDPAGRICLRMAEEDRARFAESFGTEPVEQYGAIMRGYVAIPNERLVEPDALEEAFATCLRHARSLKKK
ncbi:hypothetical protein SLH49_14535 [Cognatiyoonia sp. IB215446]|uniref:hypothetical protein n=1 Tax=Cognatiyoonia sp. IB215446 TaxID=3097355 RepID=UPI002A17C9B6|nr:hypothetical protein [Cognatiyoonia sp. IB215446]MDX8349200.1 hypothetical protein [Cognatiyoonia sp. IB215446]